MCKSILVSSLKIVFVEQVDESLGRQLPQCLCGACARKLIGAYYFVKQALAANELLMNHVQDNGKAAANDCLQEAPMELCAEQHVEVCMALQ